MSTRSRLVSQHNKKLKLNREHLTNSTGLSPITFGVILPPKLRDKISTNSQINPVNADKNKNSKICTIKILYSGASASIIHKYVIHKDAS